jgi:tRNA A-37 threonylcarbamoyl transferase component Bud32
MNAPDGYVEVRAVGGRGFALPAAAAWVEQTLGRWGTLARASVHDPSAIELQGRGVVRAVPAPGGTPGGRWVIRRYLRGGWAAPILHDRYLRRGPSRPLTEARASNAARERGIPTPQVQAGVTYRAGLLWYRADLVTTFVPNSVDLAELLFHDRMPTSGPPPTDAQRVVAISLAGRLARRLAGAGIYHPDLNAKNFLIVNEGPEMKAHVLDLDRARIVAGAAPLAPMAARLTRSLRKFETATGAALGEEAWGAFRDTIGARYD